QTYKLRIDYDRNGTTDASGQARMTGVPVITSPSDNGTVDSTFIATWIDPASNLAGYAPVYWLSFEGTEARDYLTTSRSKLVGNRVEDTSFYGFPQPNAPLSAGQYLMEVLALDGPGGPGLTSPNFSGQNTTGFFYAVGGSAWISFTATGI